MYAQFFAWICSRLVSARFSILFKFIFKFINYFVGHSSCSDSLLFSKSSYVRTVIHLVAGSVRHRSINDRPTDNNEKLNALFCACAPNGIHSFIADFRPSSSVYATEHATRHKRLHIDAIHFLFPRSTILGSNVAKHAAHRAPDRNSDD